MDKTTEVEGLTPPQRKDDWDGPDDPVRASHNANVYVHRAAANRSTGKSLELDPEETDIP